MNKVRIKKLLTVLLALCVFSALIAAQETDDLARADALFQEAGALADQNTPESFESALSKALEARKIYEKLENAEKVRLTRVFEGLVINKKGFYYLDKNDRAQAQLFFESSAEVFRENDHPQGEAEAYFTLGYLALERKASDEALAIYARSLELFLAVGDGVNAATVLTIIGDIYIEKKDPVKAAEKFESALAILDKTDEPKKKADINEKLGSLYLQGEDLEKAFGFYLKASEIYRTFDDKAKTAGVFHNLGYIADSLEQNDKAEIYYREAAEAYRDAGDESGEVSILRNLGLLFKDRNDNKTAVEVFSKALSKQDKIEDKALIADLYSGAGNASYNLSKFEDSIKFLDQSLKIRRRLGQTKEVVQTLNELGFSYTADYELEKANENFEEVVKAETNEEITGEKITALTALQRNYYFLNKFDEAEKYLDRAVGLAGQIPAGKYSGYEFFHIGRSFSTQKKYDKAREFLLKASELFEKNSDKESLIVVLNDIGTTHYLSEQYENAADYFRRAQILAAAIDNASQQGYAFLNLGDVAFMQNRFDESRAFYEKALSFAGDDSSGEARLKISAWSKLGMLQNEMGEYKNALVSLEKSLALARETGSEIDQLTAFAEIATSNSELGNYAKSLEANHNAMWLARSIRDLYSESVILNNLGIAYLRLGSLDKAEEYVKLSAKIVEKLNDPRLSAQAEGNLGAVYARLKKYGEALKYFDIALPKYRQQKNNKFLVVIGYYQGTVLRETGDLKRAVEIHRESAELAKTVSPKFESRALTELGLDYVAQKNFEAAVSVFEKSLTLAQAVEARDEKAAALDGLMQAFAGLDKNAPAIFFGKQAVNFLQETRGDVEKLDKSVQASFVKDQTAVYRRLADLLINEGRLPEAQTVLAMLKEKEYSEFLTRDADEASKLAQIVPRADEQDALKKYSEHAKTLASDGRELIRLEAKKNSLKEGEPFAERARYEELKNRIEAANKAFRLFLEKTLALEVDKTKLQEIKLDRALQGKLANWGEGTVALNTVIGADRYRVILTTPKTQIDGKTEIKAADLNKKINDLRLVLTDRTLDPRPLGRELYDILIKPVEADLERAGAKTLLWTLDGSLSYIPIGTLWDGEKYLAEKFQNVVITSTTRASLDEDADKNWNVLGAGVTNSSEVSEPFGTGKIPFKALPGVGEELQTIVQSSGGKGTGGVLPGLSLIDAGFTEAALKENVSKKDAGKRKYNVIHFATHFRLGNMAENSFLLLGNNQILTLEDVNDSTDLELTGVELVTLSACNTGFGGISGASENKKAVDSLAAFIESRGAKSVIATLWAVEDESTSLLMGEFYRLRKENPKLTKAEALRTAQKMMIAGELKTSSNVKGDRSDVMFKDDNKPNAPKFPFDEKKPFAHPLFWSPFVLIGNWR